MPHRVFAALEPVRRRQRWICALRGLCWGLIAGSAAALAVEAMRRGLGWWYAPWPSLALLGGLATVGAIVGLTLRRPWEVAAAAVDVSHNLKDRAASALEFVAQPQPSPAHRLALRDAADHLRGVDPSRAAPVRLPRGWGRAAAISAIALAVTVWPSALPQSQAALAPPLAPLVQQSQELREQFLKLDEFTKDEPDTELQELARKLIELTEEMKQPGVDIKEALAKLSEMQAAILQQQAAYSVAAVDEQLAALSQAMAAVGPLQQAGAALSQAQLDKAAQALEQLQLPPMDARQLEQAQQRLNDVAKAMKSAGMGQLASATAQLGGSLGGGNGSGAALASQIRQHSRRKSIDQWMQQQLARLSECKSRTGECKGDKLCSSCKGGGCKSCGGTGMCQSNGGNNAAQSSTPSLRWGLGASGNPEGAPTQLDSNRERVNVSGQQGEGPVDTETTNSPEGRQQAGRTYQEVYQQYRKLSEAVLENEPIPLGHRQTIRRYFESIRPNDAAQPGAATE